MGEGEAADRKEGGQFITEEDREGEKKPRRREEIVEILVLTPDWEG